MPKIRPRLTYANVVATLALFLVLAGGSALAAATLGKNSVGSRQLKSKSVTTGKIAPNAINGSLVANGTLTGEDINLSKLGTVPAAISATSAANANTVGGHAAACPSGTTLIRGLCFDSAANGPVESPTEAAEGCATRGGWLPAPLELLATREVLNLGTGVGSEKQFTNEVYANTAGSNYRTVVIDGNGAITEVSAEGHVPEHYYCVYALVR
jgi:hypothetical protein